MAVDFLGWHLLVFFEIRFVPFDRELPALSNCEDDPGSHLLFSIMGNVSHVVGGGCACCWEYEIVGEKLKWRIVQLLKPPQLNLGHLGTKGHELRDV